MLLEASQQPFSQEHLLKSKPTCRVTWRLRRTGEGANLSNGSRLNRQKCVEGLCIRQQWIPAPLCKHFPVIGRRAADRLLSTPTFSWFDREKGNKETEFTRQERGDDEERSAIKRAPEMQLINTMTHNTCVDFSVYHTLNCNCQTLAVWRMYPQCVCCAQ